MFRHPIVPPANKSTDRRRSRIQNVDAIFFDDFPEAIGLRPVRRALVHNGRRTIRQWTINNIAVAGNPADVSGAPKNIFVANVEDVFHGRINADEITACRMQNSLRFPSGAARVEKIERMLAVELRWRAVDTDVLYFPMPPHIAASFHDNFVSYASKNNHSL